MRLYKFINAQYGLEAIRDRQLKVTRIDELNDPFEFLGLDLPREGRRVLTNMKKKLSTNMGLICLSSSWQNPLMWAHYADNYKGVCLGFDISESIEFTKVSYDNDERPTLEKIGLRSLSESKTEVFRTLMYSKFKAWEHEDEYRMFATLEEPDSVSGHCFFPFSDDLKLARVVVGAQSTVTRDKLEHVLGQDACDVECFKVRAGFKRFKVEKNKLKRAWK